MLLLNRAAFRPSAPEIPIAVPGEVWDLRLSTARALAAAEEAHIDHGKICGGLKRTCTQRLPILANRPSRNPVSSISSKICIYVFGTATRRIADNCFCVSLTVLFAYKRLPAVRCRLRRDSCRFALRSVQAGFCPCCPSGARFRSECTLTRFRTPDGPGPRW
jgi:hypothetical protein